GFAADHVAALQGLLGEPNGIILVTGPTGSGKTTTLYTGLKSLNSSERKIFSVEDPIEYQLAGINQVQVQAEIGLDFPHALRAIRADGAPNIREARGCSQCGGTGFAGRSTITEILLVDDTLHQLILSNASDGQIHQAARERGMASMSEMGAVKVWQGVTTIEE